jgi:hypothetical protein
VEKPLTGNHLKAVLQPAAEAAEAALRGADHDEAIAERVRRTEPVVTSRRVKPRIPAFRHRRGRW